VNVGNISGSIFLTKMDVLIYCKIARSSLESTTALCRKWCTQYNCTFHRRM